MLLRGGGKCGELGRSGKCGQLSEGVWQERKAGEHGLVERWFWTRDLSTFGCRERQGFKTQEEGINEAGPLKKQEWDQRGGGGTTLNSCLTGECDPHPNQPLLASGPCLTGRTLWSFTSTVWSTSLCCVDDAILGGHIWASDNTILTVS